VGPWLFDTAIGKCGIWWGVRGVTRIALPEATGADPGVEPPPEVLDAITRITALLGGEPIDLTDIALDLDDVPEFHRRVYDATRQIPPGETKTYGEIAGELGDPGAARAVGQALGRNPCPIVVPCHRVLAAGGRSGGFSAPGGVDTKMRMLEIEGASVSRTLPFE
jgi:methylated-DNA-[protein]-cysteine S-methyltransferase